MNVFLTDLRFTGYEFNIESNTWTRILDLLRPLDLVEADTLSRLEARTSRVEVPLELARKIGKALEQKLQDEILGWTKPPPPIPKYIRPIATSNGLWIDPALPLLNQQRELPFYLKFAGFCRTCSGFSIG